MLSTAKEEAPIESSPVVRDISFLAQRVDTYYRERAVNPVTGGHILKG